MYIMYICVSIGGRVNSERLYNVYILHIMYITYSFIMFFFRRKSKQALRDYKKVLLQLETLEINVGDQCRKEFTGRNTLYIIYYLCSIYNAYISGKW